MEQSDLQNNPSVHQEITADNAGYETLVTLDENGHHALSVLVSGVHCAGCIQKIESTLLSNETIQSARLNFSTNRLSFSWQGAAEQANEYVGAVEKLGYGVKPYDAQAEQSDLKTQERFLLLCLGVAGFAMGNIMLLSLGLWITDTETMGMATRDLMHWIQAFIALPTIVFAGRPFFRSALTALSNGHTNMDVPISLALFLAGGMSLFETFEHGEHVYFDSAVMLMFFLLIGRYLDFKARARARSTATDLLSTLSGFATVIEEGKSKRVLIRDLKENMLVQLAAGDKIPVDGQVTQGTSEIDTALVTGETLPQAIQEGDVVFAGTINLSAPLTIQVAKAAEDSLLADIVRLMEKAGQGQAAYVRLADKAAKLYTPVVHSFAALAFLGWFFLGGLEWQDALMIAITVLIITCPCALGLAVPVVQVLATGRLMKNNILVKSGDALERLATIDTILFDKTGTLTLGKLRLDGAYNEGHHQLAASLAVHSRHPLSQALSNSYEGELLNIQDVTEHAGKGLEGRYEDRTLKLGSRSWCGDKSSNGSDKIELWLHSEGETPRAFFFTDKLRQDSKETIAHLKAKQITPIMVSGDRQNIAQSVARDCGIETVHAEKTPVQKYEILEDFKQKSHKILMVGDGLNDAPVLAGADVSMAPGTAIDMAQNAADIVFMGDKLHPVYEIHHIAQKTQRLVKQNFALAILYNMIAVPLALSGMVTPLIAAIAMSGSSLIVIANSFRLKL